MAKTLSAAEIVRWSAIAGLLLSLFVAGCADNGAATDNDKHPVFYGGVIGGGTRP